MELAQLHIIMIIHSQTVVEPTIIGEQSYFNLEPVQKLRTPSSVLNEVRFTLFGRFNVNVNILCEFKKT